MPRYYFHVKPGQAVVLDYEGIALVSAELSNCVYEFNDHLNAEGKGRKR